MKSKSKISLIIAFQIILIISSFLAIAILESQSSLLGNSVNIAGKNRLLASQFSDEIKDWAFVNNPEADPEKKLLELEENLEFLKKGGVTEGFEIKKIDDEFLDDWLKVNNELLDLKTKYLEFKTKPNIDLSYIDIIPLEIEINEFIHASNELATKLGNEIEIISENLIVLEIVLLTVNVGVHIILILIIIGIYQTEFKKNTKLEKLAAIGELSSRLAHDMRNPLNNINISIQLLKSKNSNEEDTEKFETIENSVNRLSHQIKDVMDFVRTREPNLNIWKLNTIVHESLEKIEIPKRVKISPPENNILLRCDKELFEIVLINLLLNSVDSISNEGTIKIRAKESAKESIVWIEDSGSGIPDEYLDRIFDPLITLKEKGTGLGLASCKNIIEIHGGKIFVKNYPTTFTIILPKE